MGLLLILIILILVFGGAGFHSQRAGWGGERMPGVLYIACVIVVIVVVLSLLGVY